MKPNNLAPISRRRKNRWTIFIESDHMVERILGPFELLGRIASGGMGTVYKARHRKSGRIVALKVLPETLSDEPRLVARFERELEILGKLQHPHIVRFYGGGKLGRHRFYAMELVDRGSLEALLRDRGRFSWEQTVDYGLQICDALAYAHDQRVIHRDLKPANLLLTQDGRIKLSDFGIARDLEATSLTATGRTLGTFGYMAPEQVRGKPPVSHKTDLYALGCVLFEMLTGRSPFQGDSDADLIHQHLQAKPPRVSSLTMDCPVWLDSLIDQLLEKDPDKRPRDALMVAQALREVKERVATATSVTAHQASGEPTAIDVGTATAEAGKLLKQKKKKRRRRRDVPLYERTGVLVAVLVVIAAVVIWGLWPMSENELYERAAALMATSDPSDWSRAEREYIEPMVRRFPNGQYAAQVQQWQDKIDMHRAERQFESRLRFGRDPESEGERSYVEARRYELFGDRVTALERYRSIVRLFEADEKSRASVLLAKRQIARIEMAGPQESDRRVIITEALQRADQLYETGSVLEARKIWDSIVALYTGNRELQPLVERARARLDGQPEPEADNSEQPHETQSEEPPESAPDDSLPPRDEAHPSDDAAESVETPQ